MVASDAKAVPWRLLPGSGREAAEQLPSLPDPAAVVPNRTIISESKENSDLSHYSSV